MSEEQKLWLWIRSAHLHGGMIILELWSSSWKFCQESTYGTLRKDAPFLFVFAVFVRFAVHYGLYCDWEFVTLLFMPRINQNARKCKLNARLLDGGRRMRVRPSIVATRAWRKVRQMNRYYTVRFITQIFSCIEAKLSISVVFLDRFIKHTRRGMSWGILPKLCIRSRRQAIRGNGHTFRK